MRKQIGLFENGIKPQPYESNELSKVASSRIKASETSLGGRVLGHYETIAKLKSQSITVVDVFRPEGNRKFNNPKRVDNLIQNTGSAYNGFLSPATKRRIDEMLCQWLTAIELNVNLKKQKWEVNADKILPTFVTLTLPAPQVNSDNDIKQKVLKPFLEWLKEDSNSYYLRGGMSGKQKGFGVRGFFWRAEPQKNGNIHFHILVDRFVPWKRIRQKWNECCDRLGYVYYYSLLRRDYFANGFIVNKKKLFRDCKTLKTIADNALVTRKIPERVNPLFRKYLEVLVKYGKPLTKKYIIASAKEIQRIAYEKGLAEGFRNPNSTDIHPIQNLNSITSYVIKYCTKKPKEIPLKDNQEIKYNESLRRDCVYTYEVIKDDLTGKLEKKEVGFDIYRPVFEERKVNGKLWGCAEVLKGSKVKDDEEVVTADDGKKYILKKGETFLENKDSAKALERKPFYQLKYLTSIVRERVVYAPENRNQSPITSECQIVSQAFHDYLEEIISKIGYDIINRLSNNVGPFFEKMQGKIIPLLIEKLGFKSEKSGRNSIVKHSDILEKYSPELYEEYLLHHNHIFNCIYGKAA
ncbi:rolling circle replication-associated protein [Arcticibacterium luteifluviistationis]|uniref:Replication-associated protein ORF2/G2P domain-containing protein n=1 Tax=Arcticibacterium luteifluviistationis TaxID=1784714 RepID=A0A2Z4G6E5_9BACT|nr:hypothetical protein [Arcticibacterium luteifluviistationis]AWV96714.1 hypothetical protein DJ013_00305 [Arcticibacterium luteifluviistationis]